MAKETINNIGAISALKGYRVQFLYTLYRILKYQENEFEFHPEGRFEDLDIQNAQNDIVEIVQIKNLGARLTLSDIITTKKEKPFLKRAVKAFEEGHTPIVMLVSFGEVNDDIKKLSNSTYSKGLEKKLNNLGLKNKEIELIKGAFVYEIVNESDIEEMTFASLEKWGLLADSKITFDLLLYWIYYSAEKQNPISAADFKLEFEKICKFQTERIGFNKTFNSLIQSLDNNLEEESIEHLKQDFYRGVSATYKHVLADVDVVRNDKLNSIQESFRDSNIVFVHGASGQGKSTLAYRYLKEYCAGTTVYELKHLPEDVAKIYEVINALEGISKGVRFPITLYIDVEPGNKEWINVLKELASKMNFNFLVTIREEDWNSIEVGDSFIFSDLELLFDQQEAELIYDSLDKYNKDLRFVNFENAWGYFGGNGPLLEFVYLITQNESLSAKLNSQIKKIRTDSSTLGKEKIRLLRYIVLADCYGAKVKLKEFNQFLQLDNELLFLIELLQQEYLIKISGDKSYVVGLHPVRSKIIKDTLFDNEIYKESDFVLDALSFIVDNTALVFLRNAFTYSKLLPSVLVERLKVFEPSSWQMYYLVFKSLLWKGIADYTEKNLSVLDEVYSVYNKGWITIVDFDFSGIIEGGSMIATSSLFSEEQRQYAQSVNQKFSDKKEVFSYCVDWLSNLSSIIITPRGKDEWDSFGLFLFWLHHFNLCSVQLNLSEFDFEENLKEQPLEVISHTLYALRKYNSKSLLYVAKVEDLFLRKLSKQYNIISIERDDDISCHYIFDIIDGDFETEESEFANAKSMEIIRLLRFAFPDKEHYKTNGVGHQFSFLPDSHDSSVKHIPRKNLPLKPLVDINATYLNLFDYTHRHKSWQEYIDEIIKRRSLLAEAMSQMTKAFALYHKQKNLNSLVDYVNQYNANYRQKIDQESSPKLPQNISDEWGDYSDGRAKKTISSFNAPVIEKKEELKQLLSFTKYAAFIGLYGDFDNSVETFLWQSADNISRKIKIVLGEDVSDISDNARVSLVGNLFKAYEFVCDFQKEFRMHFSKFVEPRVLADLEKSEVNSISVLSVLYRQFIYSETHMTGNVIKTASTRVKDVENNLKKSINNGLKLLSKELLVKIKLEFDVDNKRCVILVDCDNTLDAIVLIETVYNKLFEIIDQPDYTSIRYLQLSTKYPTFQIIPLVLGKTINSMCYEFKAYLLREKMYDELEPFNLIPQKIKSDIIDKHSIDVWKNEIKEFEDLDKLLESTSTAHQLAFHFSQLQYFEDRTLEDYNEIILQEYVKKKAGLFQENIQKSLDLFAVWAEYINQEKVSFIDDEDKLDFCNLMIDCHKLFYPNDTLFEKGDMKFDLGISEINEWIPRLEQLINNITLICSVMSGSLIRKKVSSHTK